MAGTISQTISKTGGKFCLATFSCTADASDGSFPDTELAFKCSGRLLAIQTDPGATAPTDNYDVTLEDANGYDVLEGVGANRDTANTEKAAIIFASTSLNPPIDISDTLTLKIANNSVNSAVITIKIYIEVEDVEG